MSIPIFSKLIRRSNASFVLLLNGHVLVFEDKKQPILSDHQILKTCSDDEKKLFIKSLFIVQFNEKVGFTAQNFKD